MSPGVNVLDVIQVMLVRIWADGLVDASGDGTELTIDYLLRAAPPQPAPAWLLSVLAVGVVLSWLLIRPLERICANDRSREA